MALLQEDKNINMSDIDIKSVDTVIGNSDDNESSTSSTPRRTTRKRKFTIIQNVDAFSKTKRAQKEKIIVPPSPEDIRTAHVETITNVFRKYISETLDSVLKQTYPHWECIIVDDGSTDNTSKIIKDYCKTDHRLKYIYQINKGASAARNNGVKNANGYFIQYLDADDAILPSKIEKMIEAYKLEDEKIILYSGLVFVSEEDIYKPIPSNFIFDLGHNVYYNDFYKYYPGKLSITPTCVLFKKEHVQQTCWNEKLGPSEDWDYFLQLSYNGYIFKYFPHELVLYRNSTGSHSKRIENLQKSNFAILNFWVQKSQKYLLTYIGRNAFLVNLSFLRKITSKTKRLILPPFNFKLMNVRLIISYFSIYPIAFLHITCSFINILNKRMFRVIKNVFF